MSLTPVTILTRFLGSGNTTRLHPLISASRIQHA